MNIPDNAYRIAEQAYQRLRSDSVTHTPEECRRAGLDAAAEAIITAHQDQVRRTVAEAGARCPADPETALAWLREKAYRFAGSARAVSGPAADRQWAIFLSEMHAYAAAATAAASEAGADAGPAQATSGTAPGTRKPAARRTARSGAAKGGQDD